MYFEPKKSDNDYDYGIWLWSYSVNDTLNLVMESGSFEVLSPIYYFPAVGLSTIPDNS